MFAAALLSLLAIAGALVHGGGATSFDWQPGLAWPQWWRAFSAVAVHYSDRHLAVNLLGMLVVAALGRAAKLPPRCAVAWLLAWPLTQLGLLLQPTLLHFGGLSGVLHAGVVIAGVHLAWRAAGPHRLIGVGLLVGIAWKSLAEQPWGEPLRHAAGWDIALAPLAHATGAIAGLACAVLVESWSSLRPGAPHPTRELDA